MPRNLTLVKVSDHKIILDERSIHLVEPEGQILIIDIKLSKFLDNVV